MRVEVRTPAVRGLPGSTSVVELEVFNTSGVIAGVTARVLGLDASWVRVEPSPLALFPETSGTLRLHLDLPANMPAGTHVLTVEVSSNIDLADLETATFELAVEAIDLATVTLEPASATGRTRAEIGVVVDNRGNTPLEVALSASDPERALRCTVEPPTLVVGPAERVVATLVVEARRRWFGGDVTRPVTVLARSERDDLQAVGSFTQRPRIGRGIATAAILAAIVALWAAAAVLGIGAALDRAPAAKIAPAGYFAPGSAAAVRGAAGTKGLDPAVVGGGIEGRVVAGTDLTGVDRITVEAIRETRRGPQLIAAAATDEEGEFALTALLPGSYKLRFTATGFVDVWYPAAAGAADATPVVVGPDEQDPVQVEIVGLPGSLSGRVQASGGDVATAVQVVPVVGGVRGAPVQATTTGAGGAFALAGLPTPATYELVFTAEGFAPTSRVESLRGGEQLTLDAVRLSAGDGSIAGTVTDGTSPLGGVAVTVRTGGQQAAATVTPTSGAVGTFVFPELTTPGTYLLSFERDGYGTETVAVELGPGEARTDLSVALSGGTGTITGTVVDAAGAGLGEVTVAILGGPTTVQAATLTSGQVGSWRITGLATPGDYTATFSKPGYRTEAVAVTLGTGGSAQAVDVVLTAELGAVVGAVRSADGTGLAGVQVVATDGTAERPTTSATAPRLGAYALESLPAGAYSITFSAPGHAPSTHLVHLGPGQRATLDVTLVAP